MNGTACTFGPHVAPASWWTPLHIGLLAGAVLAVTWATVLWPGPLAWLWDRTLGLLDRDRMSRSDAARWRSARSMKDLGELVIAWLDGHVTQTPGHCGPPCDETIPLIPSLTILNRGGFVTDNSQLAESMDGRTWNTWVSGFASGATLESIREACDGTDLEVSTCRGHVHQCDCGGPRHHGFYWACPWRECLGFWADRCPDVADELYGCWFVVIEDPEPGRNDLLWPTLEKALGPAGSTS